MFEFALAAKPASTLREIGNFPKSKMNKTNRLTKYAFDTEVPSLCSHGPTGRYVFSANGAIFIPARRGEPSLNSLALTARFTRARCSENLTSAMCGVEAKASFDSRFQRSVVGLFLAAASLHEPAPLALNTYLAEQLWKIFFLIFAAIPLVSASAEPIIPASQGMTWHYHMTQEAGEGLRFSDLKTDEDGKARTSVAYRINGNANIDGKNLLRFEMHRDDTITNTDLVTVDEKGIICSARIDQNAQMTRLEPPQVMIGAPLKTGMSWDFDGEVAGTKVHQHYSVIGEQDVVVPAGKFRAFQIHGEQDSPNSMTIDRWFVKGTGIVKDVTAMRAQNGDLVRRITLELKERPKIEPRPEVKSPEARQKLTVAVGKEPIGAMTTTFKSDTPKIYARWRGEGLRRQAKIRSSGLPKTSARSRPPTTPLMKRSPPRPLPIRMAFSPSHNRRAAGCLGIIASSSMSMMRRSNRSSLRLSNEFALKFRP